MPNFSPPSNYDYGDETTKGSQKLQDTISSTRAAIDIL